MITALKVIPMSDLGYNENTNKDIHLGPIVTLVPELVLGIYKIILQCVYDRNNDPADPQHNYYVLMER